MREKIEAPAIANRRGFAFLFPLVALRDVLDMSRSEKTEALVITARRGFGFSIPRRRKPRTCRGLGVLLGAAYPDASPEQPGPPSSNTLRSQRPVQHRICVLATHLPAEVQPVMHGRGVVPVPRHQREQHEQERVVQHFDAREVRGEAGGHNDRALIIVGQHQVIEQRVRAPVGLLGFQCGGEAAQDMTPKGSNKYPD